MTSLETHTIPYNKGIQIALIHSMTISQRIGLILVLVFAFEANSKDCEIVMGSHIPAHSQLSRPEVQMLLMDLSGEPPHQGAMLVIDQILSSKLIKNPIQFLRFMQKNNVKGPVIWRVYSQTARSDLSEFVALLQRRHD